MTSVSSCSARTCFAGDGFLRFATDQHDLRDLLGCHAFVDQIVNDDLLIGDCFLFLGKERH